MAGDSEVGKKVGETWDEAVASDAMDFITKGIPAAGMMTIGMAGPSLASAAAIHGLSGTNWVGRNSHLAGQIQGAGNLASKLEAAAPGTIEKFRAITRPLFAAERKQMANLDDRQILHLIQDFHGVPQSWNDALQKHLDEQYVVPPEGTVSGKTWEQYRDEMLSLESIATQRMNRAREAHGEETVDNMGPLHPGSVSSVGTSNLFTRQFSELGSAILNTPDAYRGSAKGFNDKETLLSDLDNAYSRHTRLDEKGFFVPKKDFRYLTHQGKGENARVKIEDGRIYPLDKSGNPIKDRISLGMWIDNELERFWNEKAEFGNVTPGAPGSANGYHRQFPLLENAHKATFQDFIGEIASRMNEAAALEAHPADLDARINDLRDHLKFVKDKDVTKFLEYLGSPGSGDIKTLAGRINQQKGRLGGEDGNAFTRIAAAWTPFAYKMQLGITPTPAAAQQAQVLAQTGAFQAGDKNWTGRFLKSYGKTYGNELLSQLTPGARSELRMSYGKTADPFGATNPMERGSALTERAINGDAEAIMGNALKNANPEFLSNAYTPEELQHLQSLVRSDGTVDLSHPDDMELANSVIGRYLEGHNGMDLPTSKPAMLAGKGSKAFGMYMSTPAIVTKAVSDLYRPGGLFHTGNRLKDLRGQAHVAAALSGQLLGANLVRSSALLKALSLLSAGAIVPGVSAGAAWAQNHKSNGEIQNTQQFELLRAAANRLANAGDGDLKRVAEDFVDLAVINFTGSIPLKLTDAASNIADLAGSIDRRAMNFQTGKPSSDDGMLGRLESLGQLTPFLSAPVSIAKRMTQALDASRLPADGRWLSLMMRDVSPFPFIRENSPWVPTLNDPIKAGPGDIPRHGGITTPKIKIGR